MATETNLPPPLDTTQDMNLATASSDKKSFGRDVGKLVSGTVIAQVVGICLTPIITRIFSPEIYGVASVFLSITSIILIISCFNYEFAIMLPESDKDAGAILLLCIFILTGISLLCIPFILLFGDMLAVLLGNVAVKGYLFLVPLAVFIDGLYIALRYWNTRKKRFGTQAITQALQSISGSGMKLGLGVCGFVSPGALIISGIVGNGIGAVVLMYQAVRADLALIKQSFSLKNVWNQAKRYKKFPIYDVWANLINTVSWQLPVLMLTGFFSSAVAGLYSLGFQMLQIPMNLVGRSISQVFYQRANIAKHLGELNLVVEDVASILITLSVLPFLVLGIIGGDLFSLVFGSEWSESGVYVQILCVWTMIWFVVNPLTIIFPTLELQKQELIYNIFNLGTRFLSLLIGGVFGSIYLCLSLFMISGVLVYGIAGIYLLRKSECSLKRIADMVKMPILISLILIAILAGISLIDMPSVLLCVMALGCICVYGIYLLQSNSLVKEFFGLRLMKGNLKN